MSLNEIPKPELEDELVRLRQQLAEYETIFNAGSIYFWYKDAHNRILRVNNAAAALDGREPAFFEGKRTEDIFPKEQAAAFYKDDLQVINSGKPKLNNVELHTPSGTNETRWLKISKVPTRDENGQVNGVIAYGFDLSDEEKSEVEVERSKTLLESVINGIYDPIFVKDEKHRFLLLNDTMCEMMKQSRSELLGKSDYDFFSKEQADIFWAHDDLILGSNDVDINEEEFTREGQTSTLSTIKSSFINPLTGKRNLVGSIRDITARKQAETELHQLRSYLANMIDSMPSVMIGVDKEGTVTQWNLEAARVTGVNNNDAIGQSLAQVYPRLGPDMQGVNKAISTQREVIELKRAYQHDDKTCFEDITIYPLVAKGLKGAVIRVDDVSERVRIEEMMIQTEKMLSVGGLAAGMAHEINNPLAGMMQTANVMINRLTLEDIPANLAAAKSVGTSMTVIHDFMEQRGIFRMLDAINESGERVAGIVDNMLSFARKSEENSSSHNINDLLDKSIELSATDYDLKKQYDFKSISIIKDYADDIPLLPCEGVKIQQVFLNLFRNGAEAMQEAKVAQPTFTVHSYFDREHDSVCIAIEDNGPGIDDEVRKRIFEPFFTTKPVGIGTGLGLSVSYFIITENHGGEMTVESELGKGARFCIRLPCNSNGEQP
ncbi:MAG: hypothetical protein COC04_06355 [Gammaproteobacteria bacterium]|nr:MAG: hypothetical protein COC04_06355 [Gammaproteobacteria bacterium]